LDLLIVVFCDEPFALLLNVSEDRVLFPLLQDGVGLIHRLDVLNPKLERAARLQLAPPSSNIHRQTNFDEASTEKLACDGKPDLRGRG